MRKKTTWTAVVLMAFALVAGCSDDDDNGSAAETISEDGGVVESADGSVALEFPEGAVAGDAEVTIEEEERPDRDDLYTGLYSFDIDVDLEEPVTVSIELDEEPEDAELVLANYDGDEPDPVLGSGVENGAVVGELTRFSSYGGFDISGPPGGDYRSETTIDESGGVAESTDGNFQIDFPAGAFDGEAEVSVLNLSEQMAQDGQPDDTGFDTDAYQVMANIDYSTVDELGEAATVEINADASGDQSGRLLGLGRAHGLIPGSELSGSVVVGETKDLSESPYGGVWYEITDRCEDIDPFGETCADDGDCIDGDDGFLCVCNDEEVKIGSSCNVDVCMSVLAGCAGIGVGHDGFCDDAGGWAGDCYIE